jgi:hypothetical protein
VTVAARVSSSGSVVNWSAVSVSVSVMEVLRPGV